MSTSNSVTARPAARCSSLSRRWNTERCSIISAPHDSHSSGSRNSWSSGVDVATPRSIFRFVRNFLRQRGGKRQVISDNRISAVLVSTDLDRSRQFYEDKVGLRLSAETIKNHLVFECGNGTTLLIYGRPNGNNADHTQVRFWTTDIANDVEELTENGIEFDEYDTDTFKTVDHVVTSPIGRSAWFRDPDGNTIALFQRA